MKLFLIKLFIYYTKHYLNLKEGRTVEGSKIGIRIYTVIFFLLLFGFIGFLISEGVRESDYKKKMAPKERFKKEKNLSSFYISSNQSLI